MALSTFPDVMTQAASAVRAATKNLIAIRDGSGDLPLSDIENAVRALKNAEALSINAITEAQNQPANAEAFMVSIGGPATLAEFQSDLAAIKTQAVGWNDAWEAMVGNLTAADLIGVEVRTLAGVEGREIVRKNTVPAVTAATLRQSTALADLIAALEAVGG